MFGWVPPDFQRNFKAIEDAEYRLRIRWMIFAIVGLLLIGAGRYVYWQTARWEEVHAIAIDQYQHVEPIQPERGKILDRNGVPLATNLKVLTVGVDKKSLKISQRALADTLAKYFHRPSSYYLDRLKVDSQRYVVLEKRRMPEDVERFEALKIDGVVKTYESARFYPSACAASTIGKVDIQNRGIFGLERSLNKQLSGVPGKMYRVRIGTNASTLDLDNPIMPAINGADVTTTIDAVAQQIVEEELAATVDEFKAQCGYAIVMIPQTGEILAIANYPSFDPNNPSPSDSLGFRPRPVYDLFEPGSTMKTFTFATVLENTNTRLDEIINTFGGSYAMCGKVIHDDHKCGPLSVEDGFAKSSNIVTLQLALRLRPETFRNGIKKFGFVQRSHSGLPVEQPGMMPSLDNWSTLSQATISYGHGISVTALQMTAGYSALANEGVLMHPQLIKRIDWTDQVSDEYDPEVWARPVSAQTAATMLQLLHRVTIMGTGKEALIEGINVGGKTGTAKKLSEHGGYMEGHTVANFIGIAPIDNPKLVCAVVVDDPRAGSKYGGIVAAPCWRKIVSRLLKTLPSTSTQSVPVSYVGMSPSGRVTPDLTGFSPTVAGRMSLGWNIEFEGKGNRIVRQDPPAGFVTTGNRIRLILASGVSQSDMVTVPNLVSKSIRTAINELSSIELVPTVKGVGRVLSQNPIAGTPVQPHSAVILMCEGGSF